MLMNLLPPAVVATRWNLNENTLSQWRWNGRGPKFLKLGRTVMYRIEDIETFEQERLKENTSQ